MVSKRGCVGWMRKRTNLEKTLLSLSSLLLLTLLLMILFGIAYHGKTADDPPEEEDGCWSNECLETAGEMLSTMDSESSTCKNFYGFACGRYGREPEQSVSAAVRSINSVYFTLKNLMESQEVLNVDGLDDVRNFYRTCVAFGSHQEILDTAKAFTNLMSEFGVGVFPIIDPHYNTKTSFEGILANLILLNVPVMMQMDVIPDGTISGAYLVKISPGVPEASGRTPSEIRRDAHLMSSMLTSVLLLGATSPKTGVDDILSIEVNFAKIEQDKTIKCDVIRLSPEEAESELKRFIDLNWTILLSKIRNSTGLLRPFAVELHCWQRIRDYVVQFLDKSDWSGSNYLGWRFFWKFVEHVIPGFVKYQFGSEENVPRWRLCLELMEEFFSPVLAEVLTKKMISKEMENEIEKISKTALATTKQMITQARWLTKQQKSKITEKVSKIMLRYPFEKKSSSKNMHVHIPQVDLSNFTEVVIRQERRRVIQKFKKLTIESGPSGDGSKISSPEIRFLSSCCPFLDGTPPVDLTVSVYVDKIISPFCRLYETEWINYAGFGVSISRQILEVLISPHKEGNYESEAILWSAWKHHQNTSTCSFTSFANHLNLDSKSLPSDMKDALMREIFLDRGSVEIAYESAKSSAKSSKSSSLPGLQELSNEKMFFLSHAQTQCDVDPASNMSAYITMKDRFNSMFLSSRTFNEVFNCESTSSQCHIWA